MCVCTSDRQLPIKCTPWVVVTIEFLTWFTVLKVIYVSQNRCKGKCFLWTVETSYETSTIRKLRVRNKTITLDESSTTANVALNYIRVNWIEATARKSVLNNSISIGHSIRHNIVTKSHPWFDVEHEPRPLFCMAFGLLLCACFCVPMHSLLSMGTTIGNRIGRSTCVYIYLSIHYERLSSMLFSRCKLSLNNCLPVFCFSFYWLLCVCVSCPLLFL